MLFFVFMITNVLIFLFYDKKRVDLFVSMIKNIVFVL